MKTESSYSHVLKYTGIFGGVQGLGMLVGLVRNKLVAVLLGPGGVGLISLFNSTVVLVSNATNLGISFSAIRHLSELLDSDDEAKKRHFIKVVRAWSLLTALIGLLICIALSPLLNRWTFSWGDHTLHFVFLSPMVAMMAVTGGEMAILKAAKQLKSLALISIYTVFAALLITVPLYYFFGVSGIVPSLVGTAFATMLITINYSYRLYPLTKNDNRKLLGDGLGMLKIGISFTLAGILGSGAELIIRSYLNNTSSLDTVGLYNAGFLMIVTYASMVFNAMDTDYFPRLSSVNHDTQEINLTVNRQIEVWLLLISPMLVVFIIMLLILLPLLFSGKFIPIIGMTQVATFSVFFKAMTLPAAYITLAKGDSIAYLLLEAVYDVCIVSFIVFGFDMWGIYGTGIALSLAGLVDFLIINIYAYIRYCYRISSAVLLVVVLQVPLLIITFAVTFVSVKWIYWSSGLILIIASSVISIFILHKKTSLWTALMNKAKSKFGYE